MPIEADDPVLTFIRGDTFVKEFVFKKRDPDVPDALLPLDLRPYGDVWQGQLRKSADSDEATNFTVDATDAENGVIRVSLSSLQTRLLPSKGVWDLQVSDTTQSPAFVRTMLRGTFEREKDVTRS